MDRVVNQRYLQWCNCATEDNDLIVELNSIRGNDHLINDAFYRDLEFGTGGLRGVIGAGTNRMNIYTVRKASQGLANYLNKYYKNPSIAISYDSRIKSKLFAETAAEIFSGNGIKVFIYKQLMPTPCLSFAVRKLKCCGGIMVTASHNPSKYNGYKVYNKDGCQITNNEADEITLEIENVDIFKDTKHINFHDAINLGKIAYIDKSIYDDFINCVKSKSVLKKENINKNIKIVYTPLNGTGLLPVTRVLKESGFNEVIIVKEQELPDGNFPTCPYPNPEIADAMKLGISYAKKNNADLLLATDPDCDRVGIAIKNNEGNFELLSGNQVGVLLLDFICKLKIKNLDFPNKPVAVKTIVTTDMVDSIANKYGVELKSVLTGFKYIGELIGKLEKDNRADDYILGFEESYGYLSGTHVRDKDAVNGSLLIAEMFAYYKNQNKKLIGVLLDLYKEHGYYLNKLETFEFEGQEGCKKMVSIMNDVRNDRVKFSDFIISEKLDYQKGINNLPKSNVIKFIFANGSSVTIRPSGTEPKIKIYYSIKEKNEELANSSFLTLENCIKNLFN